MDFFGVVRTRRSIRAFKTNPVDENRVQRILDAINHAPSAGNLQSYEVYIVRAEEKRMALMQAAGGKEFIGQAPVVLAFCTHGSRAEARYHERGTELYCVQDATIACTYAMLAATALGLSSVWVGQFDEQAVAQVLGAPDGQRPIALLPIGYAAESPEAPTRRATADLAHEVK